MPGQLARRDEEEATLALHDTFYIERTLTKGGLQRISVLLQKSRPHHVVAVEVGIAPERWRDWLRRGAEARARGVEPPHTEEEWAVATVLEKLAAFHANVRTSEARAEGWAIDQLRGQVESGSIEATKLLLKKRHPRQWGEKVKRREATTTQGVQLQTLSIEARVEVLHRVGHLMGLVSMPELPPPGEVVDTTATVKEPPAPAPQRQQRVLAPFRFGQKPG